MTKHPPPNTSAEAQDEVLQAEISLGQALAAIQRILPKLDDFAAASEVQAALRRASTSLENARSVHQRFANAHQVAMSAKAQADVQGEIVAVIAAAVSVVLGRPYRLVSVAKVPVPVPHLNVWALEGRTQIFQSHRIR